MLSECGHCCTCPVGTLLLGPVPAEATAIDEPRRIAGGDTPSRRDGYASVIPHRIIRMCGHNKLTTSPQALDEQNGPYPYHIHKSTSSCFSDSVSNNITKYSLSSGRYCMKTLLSGSTIRSLESQYFLAECSLVLLSAFTCPVSILTSTTELPVSARIPISISRNSLLQQVFSTHQAVDRTGWGRGCLLLLLVPSPSSWDR